MHIPNIIPKESITTSVIFPCSTVVQITGEFRLLSHKLFRKM